MFVELGWLSKWERIAKVLFLFKCQGKAWLHANELWQVHFWLCIWIPECHFPFYFLILSLQGCSHSFCYHLRFQFPSWAHLNSRIKCLFPGKKTQNHLLDPSSCQFIRRPGSVLRGSSANRFATDHRGNDPFLQRHRGWWSKAGHMGNDFSCHLHFVENHVTAKPEGLLIASVSSK